MPPNPLEGKGGGAPRVAHFRLTRRGAGAGTGGALEWRDADSHASLGRVPIAALVGVRFLYGAAAAAAGGGGSGARHTRQSRHHSSSRRTRRDAEFV